MRRRPVLLSVHSVGLCVAAVAGLALAVATPSAAVTVPAPRPGGIVHPDSYCSPSGESGGTVDQSTVLARAQAWVDANEPYSETTCAHLPGGYYREDCSGFVSMAWELTESLVTWDFNPSQNGGDKRFQAISQGALQPGDAVVVDNSANDHIALFVGWGSSDHGAHRYADLQEESEPGVGTIEQDNQDLDGSYWGQFTPIHYVNLTTAPTIVSGSSAVVVGSTYHVFWTRSDGHVMQSLYSGSGWHVQDLGGTLVGSPAVLYHRSGSTDRYDVFAVSPGNKQLYQDTYTTGGSWSGWRAIGGSWAPGVSGVYVGGTYHVFGHSPSGHLYQYLYAGSGWKSQDLGGVTSGTPAVLYHASGSSGRYDVFAVSPGGGLYQDTYTTGGSWSGWHRIVSGSSFAPGASGVYSAGGAYHVFVRSASKAMEQVIYDGSWEGPQNLGGTLSDGAGLTYQHGSGSDRYDLFGPGTNPDHIYQSTYTSGGHWSTWHQIN